ncbi:hypothetical protein [Burkholderia multivorans]|uniref:hypothetical protein n=1 Tax=Burkholderia multivorans TaxID=87883 RepID=UPI00209E7480|nr:hypothetical protein [Burkholderia multivorans]MCO8588923.1 hypothetical protein [Burkholderia multivorans]MCO8631298.1 hypothetical protein [Burkholderia multivorans]MCO8646943.1 hypothetical protein [Burkholderia multivorans]
MEQYRNNFIKNVVQKVIEAETNDGRFEAFCRRVLSIIEGGALILSTSASWDLGRDGVGAGAARGTYLCCSLRDDVDSKAISDIERITETTKNINRLYFCSSQSLSEHRISSIEGELEKESDFKFPVVCYGSSQLTEVALQNGEELVREFYNSEIEDCIRAIYPQDDDKSEEKNLRLALISIVGDDSYAIKNEIYSLALLDILKGGPKYTLSTCANKLAAHMKLSRAISTDSILPYLNSLHDQSLISFSDGLYQITEAGLERLNQREIDGARRLVEGRALIRGAIEGLIGSKIGEDDYAKIWGVLEEKLALYLYSRGEALVQEIAEFVGATELANSVTKGGSRGQLTFLDELATAVGATSSHPERKEELRQAIADIFMDRTGPAADWLVRVSAAFVAACALGLEQNSGRALSRLLARTTIVLDTDVVLSLLGIDEPEYDAVTTIVKKWRQNGGNVLIGIPVLEEVAYHAFIAQNDFNQVADFLPGNAEERSRLIENVFVRSFGRAIELKQARLSDWNAYISQFRGKWARDSSEVYSYVNSEYRISRLPERSTAEAELENRVRDFLIEQIRLRNKGVVSHNAADKARRDAELYAALVHQVRVMQNTDPGATCVMVSSARRLAAAEAEFHETGEPQLIVSIAAALYLVSMLPGVSFGLSAMKAFLFDDNRPGFSSDLERTLLRMVKSSREVSMPFAKRTLLMRKFRERMIKDAHSGDENKLDRDSIKRIERNAFNEENKPRTIRVLADSLDAIAVDARSEKKIRDLEAKVKELEKRLAGRRTE